jgi:hypothetical protein
MDSCTAATAALFDHGETECFGGLKVDGKLRQVSGVLHLTRGLLSGEAGVGKSRRYSLNASRPTPRKPETPPTSEVLVIGDSLADWLGYGLEEVFADAPEID